MQYIFLDISAPLSDEEYNYLLDLNKQKGARREYCLNYDHGCTVFNYPRLLTVHTLYCFYPKIRVDTVKGRILTKSIKPLFSPFNLSFPNVQFMIRQGSGLIKLVINRVNTASTASCSTDRCTDKYMVCLYNDDITLFQAKVSQGVVVLISLDISRQLLSERCIHYKIRRIRSETDQ